MNTILSMASSLVKFPTNTGKRMFIKMCRAEADRLLAEMKKLYAPDLTGLSQVVHERFEEADEIAWNNEDYIVFINDMEKALIGTTNINGTEVAVYEEELCIKCIMESFGPDWYEGLDYSEEEIQDEEHMQAELYLAARDYFSYNTLRSLPYYHEHAPLILHGFMTDSERWDSFRDA